MTCPHSTRDQFPCSQCLGITARRVAVDHPSPVPRHEQAFRASARRGGAMRWAGRTKQGVVGR